MDDCILSSLSLPPGAKAVTNTTSCSPALKDLTSPEHQDCLDAPINTSCPERAGRRSSETFRQRLKETKDSGSRQPQVRGGNISQERKAQNSVSAQPCDETIDLTASNEGADTDLATNGDIRGLRGARAPRKRKLSGGEDVPTAKQCVEAAAFL